MDHLFDYQKAGAKFLADNPAAFLADQQGLGKTIQVIAACDMLGLKKVAVICPAIAKINWKREFDKWGTLEREVVVYSYDKITQSKEARNVVAKLAPDVIVIDESHYLKNRQAKRTKYIYGQHCRGDGLVRFADRVWLLSGTPVPNDVSDMWTHLKAIWQYPLNFVDYTLYFCKTWNGQFGLKVLGNKAERMGEFKDILKSIMLRRKADKVLTELPPIWWQDAVVEAEGWSDTKHIEDDREREAVELIIQSAVTQDDLSAKLDNIAPHLASLRRLTALAKAKPIATQLASELKDHAYDKVVVFAYHKAALEVLREELSDFNPAYVVGGLANQERQSEIDRRGPGSAPGAVHDGADRDRRRRRRRLPLPLRGARVPAGRQRLEPAQGLGALPRAPPPLPRRRDDRRDRRDRDAGPAGQDVPRHPGGPDRERGAAGAAAQRVERGDAAPG